MPDKFAFLIDECVLSKTTQFLRTNGFRVKTVQELGLASAVNGEVINLARSQGAILLTTDIGMANLEVYPLTSHHGLILLRPNDESPAGIEDMHTALLKLLKTFLLSDIRGSLCVVDGKKFRIRKA